MSVEPPSSTEPEASRIFDSRSIATVSALRLLVPSSVVNDSTTFPIRIMMSSLLNSWSAWLMPMDVAFSSAAAAMASCWTGSSGSFMPK